MPKKPQKDGQEQKCGVIKQQLHVSKRVYKLLKKLCHQSKNIRNCFIYNERQHYKKTGKRLSYSANYHLIKEKDCFKKMNSGMACDLIKSLDWEMKSFLSRKKKEKEAREKGEMLEGFGFQKVRRPGYCPKNGVFTLVIMHPNIRHGKLLLPLTNKQRERFKNHLDEFEFNVPPNVDPDKVAMVRIVPKQNGRFFEAHYVYNLDEEELPLDRSRGLAIDLGVDNFATCGTNYGKSFIIDGKSEKSRRNLLDKQWAYFKSQQDRAFSKKKWKKPDHFRLSEKQKQLLIKNEHCTFDYVNKSARKIIDFCLMEDIGVLVLGYTPSFQQSPKLGRKNNRFFSHMPYGLFKRRLEQLCKRYGILFFVSEESYTSKASFLDQDWMPVYDPKKPRKYSHFSGKRVHRGLYVSKNGTQIHADLNGALNILRKAKVISFDALYQDLALGGVVGTPERIKIT